MAPVAASAHVAAPDFQAKLIASWMQTAHVELERNTISIIRLGA